MFDGQLDFSGDDKNNYFIFTNQAGESERNFNNCVRGDDAYYNIPQSEHFIEDVKHYQIERNINNDNYAYEMHPEFSEQLNYMLQNNVASLLPQEKPNPLIYSANAKGKVPSRKGQSKISKFSKFSKLSKKPTHPWLKNAKSFVYGKTFKPKKKKASNTSYKTEQPSLNNWNSGGNSKGLFDPGLKKNELDYPKKTQLERMERLEKIKNYDVKFGSKVKKLQMYNNYLDLLEDVENNDAEREFNKKDKEKLKSLIKSGNNSKNGNRLKELYEELDKIPKPNFNKANNLDFNFSQHEQMIKSLEEQIERERKMRTDINMKYVQKMKEYEELKFKQMVGAGASKSMIDNKGKINPKTKNMLKRYSSINFGGKFNNFPNYKSKSNMFKTNRSRSSSKFKLDLNKSAEIIKQSMPKDKRMNSADKIKEQMKIISPNIEKMVDKNFNSIYKNVMQKNKILVKKVYGSARSNSTTRQREEEIRNNYDVIKVSESVNNDYNDSQNNQISQNINPTLNSQKFSSPISPINYNSVSSYNRAANINSTNNNNNFVFLDSSNVENKMMGDIIAKQNLQKFEKMNKLEMLTSLNKEIENYNRGLPQLMEKVESTIDKINKVNIFDEKTHPIIQMASKHSGHLIHLHMDEIVDSVIDDLLLDCVSDLQKIEEMQNNKHQKDNFKAFIKDYYLNFSMIRNLESDISKKLTSKNYLSYEQIKNAKENEEFRKKELNLQVHQAAESEDLRKIKTPNPNHYINNQIYSTYAKSKYSAKLPHKLIYNAENYSKNVFEYMKTTGAFYYPNIFIIYDELVKDIVDEVLDDQLDFCVKQLDTFVSDMYKEEVFKLDNTNNIENFSNKNEL